MFGWSTETQSTVGWLIAGVGLIMLVGSVWALARTTGRNRGSGRR